MKTTRNMLVALAVASVAAAGPAVATAQQKTTAAGGFSPLVAGEGTAYEGAHGSARIVRDLRADTTSVTVVLNGLASDTEYPAHLHIGTCDDVGGHYQHDPESVSEPSENELWPTLHTDERGRARTTETADWVARSAAAAVVVHHPGSGDMVLCADV